MMIEIDDIPKSQMMTCQRISGVGLANGSLNILFNPTPNNRRMRHAVMASIANIRIIEVNESDDIKGHNRVALFP